MVARRFSAVYMTRLWPKLREAEGTGEKFLLKKNNQKATLLFKYTLIYLVVDIKGFLFSFFFFWLHLQHAEVSGPGIQPEPQE